MEHDRIKSESNLDLPYLSPCFSPACSAYPFESFTCLQGSRKKNQGKLKGERARVQMKFSK